MDDEAATRTSSAKETRSSSRRHIIRRYPLASMSVTQFGTASQPQSNEEETYAERGPGESSGASSIGPARIRYETRRRLRPDRSLSLVLHDRTTITTPKTIDAGPIRSWSATTFFWPEPPRSF